MDKLTKFIVAENNIIGKGDIVSIRQYFLSQVLMRKIYPKEQRITFKGKLVQAGIGWAER